MAAWVQPYNPPKTHPYFYLIIGLAAWGVKGIFFVRRKILRPSEQVLSAMPEDAAALRRWRTAYVATYAICDAIALWGLVVRFLGFGLLLAMPFFGAGFLLMLYFAPRRPTNAIG